MRLCRHWQDLRELEGDLVLVGTERSGECFFLAAAALLVGADAYGLRMSCCAVIAGMLAELETFLGRICDSGIPAAVVGGKASTRRRPVSWSTSGGSVTCGWTVACSAPPSPASPAAPW